MLAYDSDPFAAAEGRPPLRNGYPLELSMPKQATVKSRVREANTNKFKGNVGMNRPVLARDIDIADVTATLEKLQDLAPQVADLVVSGGETDGKDDERVSEAIQFLKGVGVSDEDLAAVQDILQGRPAAKTAMDRAIRAAVKTALKGERARPNAGPTLEERRAYEERWLVPRLAQEAPRRPDAAPARPAVAQDADADTAKGGYQARWGKYSDRLVG